MQNQIKKALSRISSYSFPQIYDEQGEGCIEVTSLTEKAGHAYEKIRTFVDYQDEHTLRRRAIARILKRKIIIESEREIGEALLQELVVSGYLPNATVKTETAELVQKIINKYLSLSENGVLSKSQSVFLCSFEIENLFSPYVFDDELVLSFFKLIKNKVDIKGLQEKYKNPTLYAGVWARTVRADKEDVFAAVFRFLTPNLFNIEQKDILNIKDEIRVNFALAKEVIKQQKYQIVGAKLKNISVSFIVLRELFLKYGADLQTVLVDKDKLEKEIETVVLDKFLSQYKKASESGMRAVLYIFLTKGILAFLVELPYEILFLGSVQLLPLITNIAFHPLLLLAIVRGIREPTEEDVQSINKNVLNILSDNPKIPKILVDLRPMSIWKLSVYILFYWTLFVISFGFILAILSMLHFNIVSVFMFVLFLTLVMYFGFRIRFMAEKWRVASSKKEGVFVLLFDFLAMPIVQVGRWLSERFSAINVFVFILDFIIETPFKLLLSSFDSFANFLKQQRDTMV